MSEQLLSTNQSEGELEENQESPQELYEQGRYADLVMLIPTLHSREKMDAILLLSREKTLPIFLKHFDNFAVSKEELHTFFVDLRSAMVVVRRFFSQFEQESFSDDEIVLTLVNVFSPTDAALAAHYYPGISENVVDYCIAKKRHLFLVEIVKILSPALQQKITQFFFDTKDTTYLFAAISEIKGVSATIATWIEEKGYFDFLAKNVDRFEEFDTSNLYDYLYKTKNYQAIIDKSEFFPMMSPSLFQEILDTQPSLKPQLAEKFSSFKHVDQLRELESIIGYLDTGNNYYKKGKPTHLMLPHFETRDDQLSLVELCVSNDLIVPLLAAASTGYLEQIPAPELFSIIAESANGYSKLADWILDSRYEEYFIHIPSDIFEKILLVKIEDLVSFWNIFFKIQNKNEESLARLLLQNHCYDFFFGHLSSFSTISRNLISEYIADDQIYRYIIDDPKKALTLFSAQEVVAMLAKSKPIKDQLLFGDLETQRVIAQALNVDEMLALFDDAEHPFIVAELALKLYGVPPKNNDQIFKVLLSASEKKHISSLPFNLLLGVTFDDLKQVYENDPSLFELDVITTNLHAIAWNTFPSNYFVELIENGLKNGENEKLVSLFPWLVANLPKSTFAEIKVELEQVANSFSVDEAKKIVDYFFSIDRMDGIALFLGLFTDSAKSTELSHWQRSTVGTKIILDTLERLYAEGKYNQVQILQNISSHFTLDGSAVHTFSAFPDKKVEASLSLELKDVPQTDLTRELGIFYAHQLLKHECAVLERTLNDSQGRDANDLVTEPKEYSRISDRAKYDQAIYRLESISKDHEKKLMQLLATQLTLAVNYHRFSQFAFNNEFPPIKHQPTIPRATFSHSELNMILHGYLEMYKSVGRLDWSAIADVAYQMTLLNSEKKAAFLIDRATDLEHSGGFIFNRADEDRMNLKGKAYDQEMYAVFLDKKSAVHSFSEWSAYLRSESYVENDTLLELETIHQTMQSLLDAPTKKRGYD